MAHHYLAVTHSVAVDDLASSSSSASQPSPPSSVSSPRSLHNDSLSLPSPAGLLDLFDESTLAQTSSDEHEHERDHELHSSVTSDSYDSAGESSGDPHHQHHHHQHQPHHHGHLHHQRQIENLHQRYHQPYFSQYAAGYEVGGGGEDGSFDSSRVSSRAASPVSRNSWDPASHPDPFMYQPSVYRNRSRNASGTTTPTLGYDKEGAYGADDYHSHHYRTSAIMRKLSGTAAPESSPVLQQKRKKPGWWARRAETRRRSHSGSADRMNPSLSLLGSPATAAPSKSSRNRSCISIFTAALLRQPFVPTKPLTILFSIVLFGCFAATVTTFLVHVLSNDKQPIPWRTACQKQQPFPHELADALKPVDVFVGVFSVDRSSERRQQIRSTWARHSKPIDLRTGQPATNIQVKFILGKPSLRRARQIALEMEMYDDLVVLDTVENMNRGKTHTFFTWAAENATVPVYYKKAEDDSIAVGFKKADYVVKMDDDTFPVLSELERHLRVTPREKTYWGYLIRNLFMAGEMYALSADLVQYIASSETVLPYRVGAEDKRVAKWMRTHPNASAIHWITERCYIYDCPKSGTTYAHGYLFPDEVERIKAEGRRGLGEEEKLRRGGELSQSYSTATQWKIPYSAPAPGLTMEEEVEALIEGGGRFSKTKWRADAGLGVEAVKREAIVFERNDSRLMDSRDKVGLQPPQDAGKAIGVIPGVPDPSVTIPAARTTRFGKDLLKDPEGVDAVKLVKRSTSTELQYNEEEDLVVEVYNAVQAPPPLSLDTGDDLPQDEADKVAADSTFNPDQSGLSSLDKIQSHDEEHSHEEQSTLESPATSSTAPPPEQPVVNLPTDSQFRFPAKNYVVPPSDADFLPPPTLRYDPVSLETRRQRMLNRPHGGTVAVHFLKRNEWFYETAIALLGREKMWDHGQTAAAYLSYRGSPVLPSSGLEGGNGVGVKIARLPTWAGVGSVEAVEPFWGSARMYGSPIVRDDGYISQGRPTDPRREVNLKGNLKGEIPNVPTAPGNIFNGGRFGPGAPKMALAIENDGAEETGVTKDETSAELIVDPKAKAETPVVASVKGDSEVENRPSD